MQSEHASTCPLIILHDIQPVCHPCTCGCPPLQIEGNAAYAQVAACCAFLLSSMALLPFVYPAITIPWYTIPLLFAGCAASLYLQPPFPRTPQATASRQLKAGSSGKLQQEGVASSTLQQQQQQQRQLAGVSSKPVGVIPASTGASAGMRSRSSSRWQDASMATRVPAVSGKAAAMGVPLPSHPPEPALAHLPSHHAGPTSAQMGSEGPPISWQVESETRPARPSSGNPAEQAASSVLTLQLTPSPASPAARQKFDGQQHPLVCSIVEEVVTPPPPAHQKLDGLPPSPPSDLLCVGLAAEAEAGAEVGAGASVPLEQCPAGGFDGGDGPDLTSDDAAALLATLARSKLTGSTGLARSSVSHAAAGDVAATDIQVAAALGSRSAVLRVREVTYVAKVCGICL